MGPSPPHVYCTGNAGDLPVKTQVFVNLRHCHYHSSLVTRHSITGGSRRFSCIWYRVRYHAEKGGPCGGGNELHNIPSPVAHHWSQKHRPSLYSTNHLRSGALALLSLCHLDQLGQIAICRMDDLPATNEFFVTIRPSVPLLDSRIGAFGSMMVLVTPHSVKPPMPLGGWVLLPSLSQLLR